MSSTNPRRGEIWYVNFDPQVGSETRKRRPAVVINAAGAGRLPLRIVVPVTDWKEHYQNFPWFTKLTPTKANGLAKTSGADSFQVKSIALERFCDQAGVTSEDELDSIVAGVALCIGA